MQTLAEAMAVNRQQLGQDCYAHLMTNGAGRPIGDLLARMIASLAAGVGEMPRCLGLDEKVFAWVVGRHFPGADAAQLSRLGTPSHGDRMDEFDDLYTLFLSHAQPGDDDAPWLAAVLVSGCMGGNHLWQDLGLWSRSDLTQLIRHSFAALADKNVHDMKWKKFFYKQLCNQEGVYTCRAPSCQVCDDYAACFGPEV